MELQVVGPESNWNNESVAHIRSETCLCWTVCPSKHYTSGIFYPQGTVSKAVKFNIIIKICKKLKFRSYFPLAEERNKWKMFSHTPLGPGPEGLFWVMCSVLFVSPPLLTEISEPQFAPNPSFELKTYTLLVRYSLLRLSAWSLTKLISVVSYYCILPALRIIVGWIGFTNKIVGGQLDNGSQRCVRVYNSSYFDLILGFSRSNISRNYEN